MSINSQPDVYICDLCSKEKSTYNIPDSWRIITIQTRSIYGRKIVKSEECHVCYECRAKNGSKSKLLKWFGYGK